AIHPGGPSLLPAVRSIRRRRGRRVPLRTWPLRRVRRYRGLPGPNPRSACPGRSARPSLHQDFAEEHALHMRGIDGDIDPPQQLFLEAIDARRAFEVALAQFAQIDLERVDHRSEEHTSELNSP